jgi:hypothetical protein
VALLIATANTSLQTRNDCRIRSDRAGQRLPRRLSSNRHRLRRLFEAVVRRHEIVCREALGREVDREGDRSSNRIREDGLRDIRDSVTEDWRTYGDLARQSYKPLGGFAAKMAPTNR